MRKMNNDEKCRVRILEYLRRVGEASDSGCWPHFPHGTDTVKRNLDYLVQKGLITVEDGKVKIV